MVELKEYTKKLLMRYSNDGIFRGKVDILVLELSKYSISRIDIVESVRFKFEQNISKMYIPDELADYIDMLYADTMLMNRLQGGVIPTKSQLYAMVVAQAVYINMTCKSIGIKIGVNSEFPKLLIETKQLYRVHLTAQLIIDLLTDNKEELLSIPVLELDTSSVSVNKYYVDTMKDLLVNNVYTASELSRLYQLLCHFILGDKRLVKRLDSWVTYGVLRLWSILNLNIKGIENEKK